MLNSDDVFSDINSPNKSIVEKVQLMEQLEEEQKESIFNIIDMALYNLKLKKTLSNALALETKNPPQLRWVFLLSAQSYKLCLAGVFLHYFIYFMLVTIQ